MFLRVRLLLLPCVLLAACEEPQPVTPAVASAAELATLAPLETRLPDLEVRADGSDRFSECLGSMGRDDTAGGDERLSKALSDLEPSLRSCLPAQVPQGKLVATVEIGKDGVASSVGPLRLCGVPWAVASCVQAKMTGADFGGSTARRVQIPMIFAPSDPNEPPRFAAAAMVALQGALRDLHACLGTAQAKTPNASATASFHLDVDLTGKIIGTNLDPWQGNQDLLTCAAATVGKLNFATQGTAVVKVDLR
jgi:hypothetical protein